MLRFEHRQEQTPIMEPLKSTPTFSFRLRKLVAIGAIKAMCRLGRDDTWLSTPVQVAAHCNLWSFWRCRSGSAVNLNRRLGDVSCHVSLSVSSALPARGSKLRVYDHKARGA